MAQLFRGGVNSSPGAACEERMRINVAGAKTTGEQSTTGSEGIKGSAIAYLAIVLRVMLTIGIVLILLGTAIGLIRDGKLPTPVVSVTHLPSMLVHLDAAAILSLGVLVFLITPATAIFYMGIS